jgi:hypothetical protein
VGELAAMFSIDMDTIGDIIREMATKMREMAL